MSADGPAPKRQKTARAGTSDAAADGPIEDDKTAREKLREAGFDPDDVHTARSDMQISSTAPSGWYNITPMTHFAFHGDLPMCRYLYHVRGAVTTTAAQEHRAEPDRPVNYYPIYVAAYEYNFDIVKWLYQHGAKSELLEVYGGASAISTCFYASENSSLQVGSVDLAKWLVLEGLLEGGSDAKPDARRLHRFLHELQSENQLWKLEDTPRLFIDWMDDLLWPNELFHNFLLGTVRDPQYSVSELKKVLGRGIRSSKAVSMLVDEAVSNGKGRVIWDQLMDDHAGRTTSSNNACLASFPGVLEKIGDYVGIIKNKTKLKRVVDAKAIAQRVAVEVLRRSSIRT